METAVIIVHVQADFTEVKHGSLVVPGTDQHYIDAVQSAARRLKKEGYIVIATRDFHPENHISFFTTHPGRKVLDTLTISGRDQVLWPPHCVQDSPGAEIILDRTIFDAVVETGTHSDYESYSGFKDDSGHPTELHPFLQENGVGRLIIFGLATDYCVKATAIDAVNLGYGAILIKGLCRGITPQTTLSALAEMKQRGIVIMDKLSIKKLRS